MLELARDGSINLSIFKQIIITLDHIQKSYSDSPHPSSDLGSRALGPILSDTPPCLLLRLGKHAWQLHTWDYLSDWPLVPW